MPVPTDPTAAVKNMLEAAGITCSPEEFQAFVSAYPTLRAGADSLYIEEVRYEEPALIFTPVPPAK